MKRSVFFLLLLRLSLRHFRLLWKRIHTRYFLVFLQLFRIEEHRSEYENRFRKWVQYFEGLPIADLFQAKLIGYMDYHRHPNYWKPLT